MNGNGKHADPHCNEKGSKVEADVAMCPLLSLFRREENRDGDTYVPYALHNYWSTATLLIGHDETEQEAPSIWGWGSSHSACQILWLQKANAKNEKSLIM